MDMYHVEYGSSVISHGSHGRQRSYYERIIWHENYFWEDLNDDIGLIKVRTAFEIDIMNFRVRLPLRGEYFRTGMPAVLAGKKKLKITIKYNF